MGRQLTVRPHFWRQLPVVLILVFYLAVVLWVLLTARTDPGTWWGIPVGFAFIAGLGVFESMWQRIVVTPDQVRLITIRRQPPISRGQIYNIRALRWNTVFYDCDQNQILKTGVDLSRPQLLALANELRVNVWDHRALYGLRELEHGVRLNPQPFEHQPPAKPSV